MGIIFSDDEENSLYIDIQNYMASSNVGIMEAVVELCNRRNIEIEYVAALISNNAVLKARLQTEAEELHFLKKTKRVPI